MSSVDVFVPCYRYGRFLRECVASALTQKGVDVRVLIIDDASPDNTAEVCQQLASEDSRVTFTRHPVNKGHIATYNEGIEWASAGYYLLLSADDYLLPDALGRAASIMDEDTSVAFVFGPVIRTAEDGTASETPNLNKVLGYRDRCVVPGSAFIEFSGARNLVPTPTAVIRTALQKRLGGYLPELPHAGDMEMWLRLAAHGSVGVVGIPQAVYRRHSCNMSLGYMQNTWLPDLEQRKAAIDLFVQQYSYRLADAESWYRGVLRSLSRDAVGFASAAFNEGALPGLCDELIRFAKSLDPDVARSWASRKYCWKRRLGTRGWRIAQPVINWARGLRPLDRRRASE